MAITPAAGYQVDPTNPNGVIPLATGSTPDRSYATPSQYGTVTNGSYIAVPDGAKPVTSISTEQGVSALGKTAQTATRLAGSVGPAPAPAPVTPTTEPKPTSVTLINPSTEQTVTFGDASINRDNINSYLSNGYSLSEASGALPDWLTPTGTSSASRITGSATPTGNAELDAANAGLAQATADKNAAVAKLTNFNVSGDPQLQTLLAGITSQWDARIQQTTDAENSRLAALQSTGIRLGSQYTGGSGGVFGGIISAEEKKITDDIAGLQQQKTQALAAAQNAYETQQWSRYYQLVQVAQKSYDDQLSATQALQKAQVAQDQKIQDAMTQSTRSLAVAKLFASGTTDPSSILSSLKGAGDSTVSSSDVAGILKDLTPAAAKGNTFTFSQPQLSQLLASGFTPQDIQGLHDYYNGTADASFVSNLSPEQQAAVHDVLNGTAAKKAASTVPSYAQANPKTPSGTKPYTSGGLTYTSDVLSAIQNKVLETKGSDGYVDPFVYKDALDAWTAAGGLAKDFTKNFPTKSYVNPAATWMPQYIQSKSGTVPVTVVGNPFQQ